MVENYLKGLSDQRIQEFLSKLIFQYKVELTGFFQTDKWREPSIELGSDLGNFTMDVSKFKIDCVASVRAYKDSGRMIIFPSRDVYKNGLSFVQIIKMLEYGTDMVPARPQFLEFDKSVEARINLYKMMWGIDRD